MVKQKQESKKPSLVSSKQNDSPAKTQSPKGRGKRRIRAQKSASPDTEQIQLHVQHESEFSMEEETQLTALRAKQEQLQRCRKKELLRQQVSYLKGEVDRLKKPQASESLRGQSAKKVRHRVALAEMAHRSRGAQARER